MNETNYARILITRSIAIIIYVLFSINFITSSIMMFINGKPKLVRLLLIILIIFFIFKQLIKSIKEIISVIKEIKEKKKFNLYLRNLGQAFMGLSFITFIFGILFRLLKNNNEIIIKIFLFGMVISIVLITIDKILVILEINNAVLEIDKSDE
ncbi:MAG: hypothetical protein IK137_03160 [Bacilli bacterium]|nr:hypothetical protein [Bacilli bacterium]